MLRDKGRIIKLIISITTRRGNKTTGTPLGTKTFKNFNPKVVKPCKINPKKKLRDSNNVKAICDVIVKPKGNKPHTLDTNIKLNNVNNKGKYFIPFGVCSVINWDIKVYSISNIDVKLSGINLVFIEEYKKTTNKNTSTKNIEKLFIK